MTTSSGTLTSGSCSSFLVDDVEAQLEIGRVDVGDQAPGEAREDARLDPVQVLRRAVRADREPPAGRDDLVHRVEEFFLGRFLAGDELDVVDHQQVGGAQLLLELDRLVGAQRGDELDHELLGRHVDDLRARLQAMKFVADRVQQMGLAAAGAAMEEERVEGDLVGARQRLGGVERDLIGLADDEILEPVARLERDRIEARRGLGRSSSAGGAGISTTAAVRGAPGPTPIRIWRTSGSLRLPGEREPLGEMGLHPIGHELGGKLEPQRAAVGIEIAERDRAQPAVEGAGAAIAAKLRANRFPRRGDRLDHVHVRLRRRLVCRPLHRARTPHLSSAARWTALFFRRKNPPRGEAPPGMPLLDADFACRRQKIRPAERLFWNRGRGRIKRKKSVTKIKYIDMRKTAELRHSRIKS